LLNLFKKTKKSISPPIPNWKPDIDQPVDLIVERIICYTNNTRDFVVFQNGTISIIPDGLDDIEAETFAKNAIHNVFHAHPDMNPFQMKDGNILIQYSNDLANIVLANIATKHWPEIDEKHQSAIVANEVLITPLGQNKFDDFGKKALFGRCYMFMDAVSNKIIKIVRHAG
jgi:hypothetical protein